MNFIDSSFVSPLSGVQETSEGYLAAEAFCVRTGVQDYLGREVGRPDLKIVKVYRPESEVFSPQSIQTFAHKPVTVDHPPGGVDASTWKDKAVGEVSTEALRDGQRLKLQLIIKDQAAVNLVKSGAKRELSAGYTCDLDWTPGLLADGSSYDAVQRNIQVNHLALVERGRAGNCRLGDSASWGVTPILQDKDPDMEVKTMTYDGLPVQVTPAAEAIINKLTADMAQVKTEAETLRGENAALTKQVKDAEMTPDRLAKLVVDRQSTMADFKSVTGKEADVSMSDADLKRVAVNSLLGDAAKDFSDEAISAAFKTLVATKQKVGDEKPKDTSQSAFFGDGGFGFKPQSYTVSNVDQALKDEDKAWESTLDFNAKEA